MKPMVSKITVLYDSECGLCVRFKDWLLAQPAYIKIEVIPMRSEESNRRYPTLQQRIVAGQFLVIDSNGEVFVNEEARILCLWALKKYRSTSFTIARSPLHSVFTAGTETISRNRQALSGFFGMKNNTNTKL